MLSNVPEANDIWKMSACIATVFGSSRQDRLQSLTALEDESAPTTGPIAAKAAMFLPSPQGTSRIIAPGRKNCRANSTIGTGDSGHNLDFSSSGYDRSQFLCSVFGSGVIFRSHKARPRSIIDREREFAIGNGVAFAIFRLNLWLARRPR